MRECVRLLCVLRYEHVRGRCEIHSYYKSSFTSLLFPALHTQTQKKKHKVIELTLPAKSKNPITSISTPPSTSNLSFSNLSLIPSKIFACVCLSSANFACSECKRWVKWCGSVLDVSWFFFNLWKLRV